MKSLRKFKELVSEVLYILDSKDKKVAILIVLDIGICAILETLGVGVIIPLVSAVSNPEMMSKNTLVQQICDLLNITKYEHFIVFLGVIIIAFYIAKSIFLIVSSYWQNLFRFNLQKKLSVKMLKAYMSRPYQFFVETNSSEVMRGIGGDVGCVKDALEVIFNLMTQGLTVIMLIAFLFCTDFLMAFVFAVVSFICIYILVYILKKKTSSLGVAQRDAEMSVTKYSYEMLDGIKQIYASRKQKEFIDTYDAAFEKKSAINIKYSTILASPHRIIECAFMMGLSIIIIVRIMIGIDLTNFVPQLAAFAMAGVKILPSMSVVSNAVPQLIFQKPGVDEAYSNIRKLNEMEIEHKKERQEGICSPFKKLEVCDVTMRYSGMENNVLNGVSVSVSAGESIAFIGASGSGKTTLIDMILGLYEPIAGKILVNGIELNKCEKDWGNMIAYVQQNVFMMDDTIRANIAFGVHPRDIDDEKIWEALRIAQLDDFVKGLDKQLDTIVGEKGVRFSGGQRQRVAIARAMYFDPQVIILDEATAALDINTEAEFMKAVDSMHGEKTIIIVAHRLSTIQNCDRVYEVKDGKLISSDVNKKN